MDWFGDAATDVWTQGLNDLYAETGFDGIWIDMNEATGFHSGENTPDKPTEASTEALKQAFASTVKRCKIFINLIVIILLY